MNHEILKNFIENDVDKCRVLVVGDAMLDKYYFGEVTRISPEAPVPINRVTKIKETLGGAANVSHNLSLLGCHTSLIAQIGTENHGDNLIDKLISRGVDILGVMRTEKPTTTKIRVISGNQQMLRLDFEDGKEISDDDAEKLLLNISAQIKNVDAVIISDYGKGVCTEKICQAIIKKCREQNKIVTVDPKGNDWKKYSGANFITPNLKELNDILPKKISNDDTEIEIAARGVIEKFNLSGLIVTRSAKGLSVICGEKVSHIPAKTQEVFDVSGAGDTVISVFTLGLAGKLDAAAAAYLANAAAGVVVTKVGTYAVNRAELLQAL